MSLWCLEYGRWKNSFVKARVMILSSTITKREYAEYTFVACSINANYLNNKYFVFHFIPQDANQTRYKCWNYDHARERFKCWWVLVAFLIVNFAYWLVNKSLLALINLIFFAVILIDFKLKGVFIMFGLASLYSWQQNWSNKDCIDYSHVVES